jgi:hypothetical protein
MNALPTFPRYSSDPTVVQATAQIATADSGERAHITILDAADGALVTLRLGEYAYQADAVEALRAAGWRVYPDTIRDLGDGWLACPVFRG